MDGAQGVLEMRQSEAANSTMLSIVAVHIQC